MLKGYLASTDRKSKEAIEYFRKALQVDSSNDGVVTELADLLILDGQVQEGEQLAMHLISRKKTSYGPAYDLMYSFYLERQPARGRGGRPESASEQQSEERRLRSATGPVLSPRATTPPTCTPPCNVWWTIPRIFRKRVSGWATFTWDCRITRRPSAITNRARKPVWNPRQKSFTRSGMSWRCGARGRGMRPPPGRTGGAGESEGQFGASSACRHLAG